MTTLKGTTFALVAATAAVLMTGCTNLDIRPADQGPRTYVAAHDSTEGDNCSRTRMRDTRNDGRYTIEDSMPHRATMVRCVNIQEDNGPADAQKPVPVTNHRMR